MNFYSEFAPVYERIFPFRPVTLEFLASWFPERGRVLDLGCGTGHYTGALAGRNLEAVGIDQDEAMIAAARERYPAALFAVSDLVEVVDLVDAADGAYCIGNVLPHIPPTSLGAFLVNLADVLAPGAPWIVQTVNFDRLLPLVEPYDFPPLDAGEGWRFLRRYEEGEEGALRFVTSLSRNGQQVSQGEVSLWPFTSGELTALHRQAGFELAEMSGSFTGDGFVASESPALIQVYRQS